MTTATRPAPTTVAAATATSLPGLLLDRAAATPAKVALRHNRNCRWEETTWAEYAERTARVGLGLAALGVHPGDRVAIHSANRPEWLYTDLGAQGVGAITVGIYPTSPAPEVEYLLGHSEATVLVAEDEEQLDKVLEVRDRLPALRHVVVIETRLIAHHLADAQIMSFADLEALGASADPASWRRSVDALDPSDVAIVVYTSGTTGPPKGAMLTHTNLLAAAGELGKLNEASDHDEVLSYLPICHIAERMNSAVNALWFGVVVNFGHGGDSLAADLQDVQPTAFLGVPRVWERMLASVQIHMADASWLKRTVYEFWIGRGRTIARRRMAGRMTPLHWGIYGLGWVMLYRSLRDKLGLRRIRIALSGAAPIAPKVLEYFWAIGVPVREAYGQTENTSIATYTPADRAKIGKVGRAYPGVEIRTAADGEIFTRSACNFAGYLKDPAATAATLDADGWLHTGDVGELDEDGFLTITDRKKDIIITAGGKNVAPSEIENHLKVSPLVREAVVIGDRRKYLVALIGIEFDTVGDWAGRHFLPYTTYDDLASKPEVVDLITEWVDHVNRELAQVERIKYFRLLPRELDHENGQLTATQKVKRRAIETEFADLIEEMYRAPHPKEGRT